MQNWWYPTLGVEVLDNRMDCIPSKNLLPTLKLNTEGQTYLTFTFMLQYNLVGERFFLFPWQLSWSCPQHKGILRKWHSGVFAKDALEDYSHKLQRGITLLNQFRLTSHLLLIERAENSDSGFGSPLDERLSMPSLCLGKTLCLHLVSSQIWCV